MTEWKSIPDFPDYEVSDAGNVRSYKRKNPRILKPHTDKNGHRGVNLRRDRTTYGMKVSQLVALTFLGPPPEGHVVHHLNGNPSDDRVENLKYGLFTASLTEQVIVDIRTARKNGASGEKLAEKYSLSTDTIYAICRGETYTWCDGPICGPREIRAGRLFKKISDEEAVGIFHRVQAGETRTSIAKEHGVNITTICKIANGRRLATKELAEKARNQEKIEKGKLRPWQRIGRRVLLPKSLLIKKANK